MNSESINWIGTWKGYPEWECKLENKTMYAYLTNSGWAAMVEIGNTTNLLGAFDTSREAKDACERFRN